MMNTDNTSKRLFFGVQLPDETKAQLERVQDELRDRGYVGRWILPELMHITVAFLGDVVASNITGVVRAGEDAVHSHHPFTVQLSHLGVFRNSRILWQGIQEEGQSKLSHLHSSLRQQLQLHGGPALENRSYRAHITLARDFRIRLNTEDEDLSSLREDMPRQWQVSQLALFESVRVNGKLNYPVVQTFPFPSAQ